MLVEVQGQLVNLEGGVQQEKVLEPLLSISIYIFISIYISI